MELVLSGNSMSYMLLSEVPMLRNQFRKLYGVYGTSKSCMILLEVPMLRTQFRKLYGMSRKLYMSYILLSEVPMYGVSAFRIFYVVYATFGSADVEESVQEIVWRIGYE